MPFDSTQGFAWRVFAAPAFCALELPPRAPLLGSVLAQGTIAHLRGPKSIGKSYLALEIALAVAGGGRALNWRAPGPRRVLFVDADMPLALLKQRVGALSRGAPTSNLSLLAAEAQDEMPSLAWPSELEKLEDHLDGVDLLVLDGLSSLLADGPPNRWHIFALALRSWRKRGLAVLLVEHRLSRPALLALEGLIDVTLALARPVDHTPQEGMRCDVVITSARHVLGDAAAPLEADLGVADSAWHILSRPEAELVSAMRLSAAGYSVREIARALRISKSRAQRLIEQGRAAIDAMLKARRGTDGPARRSRGEGGTAGTAGTVGTVGTRGTDRAGASGAPG